jgi:hypothetical protein
MFILLTLLFTPRVLGKVLILNTREVRGILVAKNQSAIFVGDSCLPCSECLFIFHTREQDPAEMDDDYKAKNYQGLYVDTCFDGAGLSTCAFLDKHTGPFFISFL